MNQERLLYPVLEAAHKLGISRGTLYKEMGRGAIKPVRIGGAVRIPASELVRYVNSLNA